ncbi:phosphoadenylyl-sulfate reductase [Entomobacter blattae]|uniref:Adenosine 5'-phosphosulfate reductase n=1 Tax=Entomobacter blattae TaxID=2762277 RepID=A0A7H1NTV2_9PROT|nr:phosphoadenylyl-sulfate reductase [Entomobacter blattae]QNT79212.1 putative phosphoadenosine phosphosulfate reductase [Entomobacter blattae]
MPSSVFNALHQASHSTESLLQEALLGALKNKVAIISSFGADSAVLLSLVSQIDRDVPVLFLQTGKHFEETLDYRHTLADHLGLRNVQDITPAPSEIQARDPEGQLCYFDVDACCALRKVEPLDKALIPYQGWITGRKRNQASTRASMPMVEPQPNNRFRINPLAQWNHDMLESYIEHHHLPRHPLSTMGYPSIGCAPCTTAVAEGEDPRSGRWAGKGKVECGIHLAH